MKACSFETNHILIVNTTFEGRYGFDHTAILGFCRRLSDAAIPDDVATPRRSFKRKFL